MNEETSGKDMNEEEGGPDSESMGRRNCLRAMGRWSAAAIAASAGAVWLGSARPARGASIWVNRRPGGGGWINRPGGWVNRPGWINRGGGWLNRRPGGGGWINRRRPGGSWVNRW
jgi:hypothetical protein